MSTVMSLAFTRRVRKLGPFLLVTLLTAACGSAPRARTESPARIKDSPPEKMAAGRASAKGLDLEREDDRWNIEAARERRRLEDEKARQAIMPAAKTQPPATPLPPP